MYLEIKQIEIISKLPGYLFGLIGITDIHEKIFLSCSKEDYESISSMLNLIGVQACSITSPITDDNKKSLHIVENLHELNILPAKNDYECSIVYVQNGGLNEASNKKIKLFLMKHPHYIVIVNTKLEVSQKQFYININQNNRYFERLQKYVLRFGTAYGIQKGTIY